MAETRRTITYETIDWVLLFYKDRLILNTMDWRWNISKVRRLYHGEKAKAQIAFRYDACRDSDFSY